MKHKDEIIQIIANLGDKENITRVTHCMTRLRFNLKDNNKADLNKINSVKGVIDSRIQNGQLQVVIGPAVADWYDELVEIENINDSKNDDEINSQNKQTGIVNKILGILSNMFLPVIPAIAGAGMMKALLGLLSGAALITRNSDTYIVLNLMADTTFYFLPVLLAISAAKIFKTNTILSAVLACALLYPTLINQVGKVSAYHFLGLPIPIINYSTSVIPIILSVWLMSYVYKFVNKHMPDMLKVVFIPTVVLLIVIPIELIVLAPIGSYFGAALSNIFVKLFSMSGLLAGLVLGGLRPLMVITGMHQALAPVIFQNFASKGYDVIMPTILMSTFAQATGVLTMIFKTRSQKEKSVIYSSGISAVLGITEPALYGVIIKYKRVLASVCIGGGLGAAYVSMMGYHLGSITPTNILSLTVYAMYPKFIHIIIGIFITVFSTSILVLFSQPVVGKEKNKSKIINNDNIINNTDNKKQADIKIYAPLSGEMNSLTKVPDEIFSSGAMGDGFAITPNNGTVLSPFDGTVMVVANTGHAVGIRSDSGVEVLIHIGIETVELKGKYFKTLVSQGQHVKRGDKLIKFDLNKIKEKYNIITPIIVTNGQISFIDSKKIGTLVDNDGLVAIAQQ